MPKAELLAAGFEMEATEAGDVSESTIGVVGTAGRVKGR